MGKEIGYDGKRNTAQSFKALGKDGKNVLELAVT